MQVRSVHPWLLACGVALAVVVPAGALAQERCHAVEADVAPRDARVAVDKRQVFLATAYDRANNPCATAVFVWTSSNANVARVDQNGIVTGIAAGVAIITARTGSGRGAKRGQATIEVVGAPSGIPAPGCASQARQGSGSGTAVGLIVAPARLSLVKGESKALTYRALQANGEAADPVCLQFSIQPSGERVAVVDSVGVVSSVGDTGRAVVRVVVPGQAALAPRSVSVEVRADTVAFGAHVLAMAPGTVDTLQIVVPGQGNRAINPAGIFQFSSSDPAIVSVSPVAPIVRALAPGTAVIVAQSVFYPDLRLTVGVRRP